MKTTIVTSGPLLAVAMKFMSSLTPEGFMTLLPTEQPNAGVMFFKAVDTAGVAIAECKLKCTYEGDTGTIGLPYEEIPTDLTSIVTLELDSQLAVHDGNIKHKIAVIMPDYIRKCGDVKVTWPFVFDIPASEFGRYLKAVCDKYPKRDSSAAIRFTWENAELHIEDREHAKIDVVLTEGEDFHTRTACTTRLETLISIDYVVNLVPSLKSFDRVVVGLGDSIPINIGGTTPDGNVGCGFILAPRIGE